MTDQVSTLQENSREARGSESAVRRSRQGPSHFFLGRFAPSQKLGEKDRKKDSSPADERSELCAVRIRQGPSHFFLGRWCEALAHDTTPRPETHR